MKIVSQGDMDCACLLPKVASPTGSLRCTSNFNSPTPACLLGVSYSESQASPGVIIRTGSLYGCQAQSQIHFCTFTAPAGKAVAFGSGKS